MAALALDLGEAFDTARILSTPRAELHRLVPQLRHRLVPVIRGKLLQVPLHRQPRQRR